MKNQDKYYKTDSFYLASYFIASGCELADIEPVFSGSNKFIFHFFNTKTLQSLAKEYFSLRASVRPQDFANAQKTLKSILYSKQASRQ